MIIADNPLLQPFVDMLVRAADRMEASVTCVMNSEAPGTRPHIGVVVDHEMKFFQLGLLMGQETLRSSRFEKIRPLAGRALFVRLGNAHIGYWENLTGRKESP